MSTGHPLFQRLMHFDSTAIDELEKLIPEDPQLVFDIGWSVVISIAEVSPHVPGGLVDGILILMQNALGIDKTESRAT